jgi:hypothetical protein
MLKGSQSRVDHRRQDLYKKLGIFAAITVPVVAAGAFLITQSFAAAGPGYGGGSPGCNYTVSTCAGGSWTYYTTNQAQVTIPSFGSVPGGTIDSCHEAGGYWRFALEDNNGTQHGLWPINGGQSNGSLDFAVTNLTNPGTPPGVQMSNRTTFIGPALGTPLSYPVANGTRGAWDSVQAEFAKVVARGDNRGMQWGAVGGEGIAYSLAWFCAPPQWGTTLTSDSTINNQHRGKNNPIEAERGATVDFRHFLNRDPIADPGTGQYRIYETKYPAKDGKNPASSSMGSQNAPQVLNDGIFHGGANATLDGNYAHISFKIPDKAVNGSIWCQHIEFWAPNDLGGHTSDSARGYPTWDGSGTTRGEVCVKVVVPVHTPDSTVNHERGPVYVRPGEDFEFEHVIDVDRPELNDGMGIYEVGEETSHGATGQCIWDPKNNGSILTNANFANQPYDPATGKHNSNLDADHATVPCTAPAEDPEGATYCENINFWTSIDGNVPTAFDSNRSWGRSKPVCAIVRIPDLKIVKTASKTDLERDEEFTYQLTVTNTDEFIDTKGLIRVTDTLPEGIKLTGATSKDMDCTTDLPANSLTCDTEKVLDPKEGNQFTIEVAAQAVGIEGKNEFDNRAYVGGGGDPKCPVGNTNPECSDNAIVRIPEPPEPPKTGVVLGTQDGTANESNSVLIISGLVITVTGAISLGFVAKRHFARR